MHRISYNSLKRFKGFELSELLKMNFSNFLKTQIIVIDMILQRIGKEEKNISFPCSIHLKID